MKTLVALLFFLGFSSLPLLAQDYSKVEVFGGYQFTHIAGAISPVGTANGWDGSFTYNINKMIGVSGDFNGAYQSISGSTIGVSGSFPGHYLSFAGGPVFYFPSKSRAKPFVHALFGGMRLSSSASAEGITVGVSKTGFTSLVGGGLDLKLNKNVSLRLVQADWVYYLFSGIAGSPSTSTSGTFKVASGVVFSFGGK